uniref:PH domain-containing protein n=1 Tax=Vannella robusta TaxID=1487602 RepID=A0A7S4HSF4_9EUKA
MAYGANIGDKTWAFSLTTPRGLVKLAAMDEAERESWVSTLRALVPKAKVEIAKEMLLRKAKRKANLELAQQQIKESIESILRDSKRVGVLGGFKSYADALAENFQALLRAIDLVSAMGLHSARQCAYTISSIVDAANSAAAVCTNRAIQDEIVVRTRDIAVDTANLLGHATTASHDKAAQTSMYEVIEDIQEQVKEILEILAASGELQQEMDEAKASIEMALENSFAAPPAEIVETEVEKTMEELSDRAKVLSTTIRNIANNACVTPDQVGKFSQDAAQLMCELLDGTSLVAYQSGIDINDPEYLAGTADINPRKKQQVESLLAAAKGFAAATTNMIDLLKQIPRQEDDENLQFRLSMATRSADNALNAFNCATADVDTSLSIHTPAGSQGYGVAEFPDDYVDGETELLASLDAIQATVAKFSVVDISSTNPELTRAVEGMEYSIPGLSGGTGAVTVLDAAKAMCGTAVTFMSNAANAQKEIKRIDPQVYLKDPAWASGVVEAAQSVADTTNQMYEVSVSPDSDVQDIVAASRCVNEATARLVAFTRVKGDSSSAEQQTLEESARDMAKAANFVVEVAKRAQDASDVEKFALQDKNMAQLRKGTTKEQIKKEFEAQAEIAKLEAELEAARQYLFKLRRAIHGGGPSGSQ